MDADKLKKKLNGAVLKGSKLRVETARPESTPDPTADTNTAKAKKEKKKKSKERKHETDVIAGVQLEGRKVKRGWTTTEQEMIEDKRKKARKERKDEKKDEKSDKKDKKKKRATVKSKYTDEPECLFKTKLPDASPSKEHEESGEEASTHKKKRKRKSGREVIVHEFEKTTKYPTFLKSTPTGATNAEATTFEDGVGWVDSMGNVVEPTKPRRRPEGIPAQDPPKPKEVVPPPREEEDDDDETSSSGSSSSDEDDVTSSSDSGSDVSDKRTKPTAPPQQQPKVEAAVLGSSPSNGKSESARPKSSGSVTSLSIKIPPTTPAAKKIHPLEALYKRPQGDHGTPNAGSDPQPFSFFGNEDDIEEDGDLVAPISQVPMTPFTKQEFEFRNTRSAAPTPDTAHPSRSFHFWASQGSADDAGLDGEDDAHELEAVAEQEQEDEDVDMEDGVAGGQTSPTPASDFQKQFWESRGDLNRAWRKRRKSAAKEKRYRDNRARAERAI
ncbi:hypothetical protein F5B18DRAFT_615655 [Nemania serpens]|nr:hypothetical protein F5B18DRAFT_615655 [Nemania serpens]